MGTIDVHARRDLRTIYREIEAASPEQLAMFHGPDDPWEVPVLTPAEPCATTREYLCRLVDSRKLLVEFFGIPPRLIGDSVETTVADV